MNRYALFFILSMQGVNIFSTEGSKKSIFEEVVDRQNKLKELLEHKADLRPDKNSVIKEFDKTFDKLILSRRLRKKQRNVVFELKRKCRENMIEAFDRKGIENISYKDFLIKQLELCIATVIESKVGNEIFAHDVAKSRIQQGEAGALNYLFDGSFEDGYYR